jgi:hypothetical protein
MTTGDAVLDKSADRLQELSDRAAESGAPTEKLARPLAEDAVLLRHMKPSLIKERLRAGTRRKKPRVSPFVVIGSALVAGVVLAKVLDWRGHAHPRG